MKSILVVSNEEEVYPLIASTYKSGFTVERAANKTAALELLKKRRCDLVFIDLDVLSNRDFEENYKESLQPFWQLYPSVEIIVMTRQDQIRKAVNAVKATRRGSCSRNSTTYAINSGKWTPLSFCAQTAKV
jgi:DNA-binding NtrC family response regulator